MPGMTFDTGNGSMGIWGTAVASTAQLRQMAATGVRLRLPYQLDFRLDTVLDPAGFHIVGLDSVEHTDAATQRDFDEPIARCHSFLKFADVSDAFEMRVDIRLRDFLLLQPAGNDSASVAEGRRTSAVTADITVKDLVPDDYSPRPEGTRRSTR